MAAKNPKIDNQSMTFEKALADLQEIVESLEKGKIGLEDAIKAYEQGMELSQYCEKRLGDAKARIEKITLNEKAQPVGTAAIADKAMTDKTTPAKPVDSISQDRSAKGARVTDSDIPF